MSRCIRCGHRRKAHFEPAGSSLSVRRFTAEFVEGMTICRLFMSRDPLWIRLTVWLSHVWG